MASLPVSGVVQRESGTFFVPFPYLINQLFHLNALQNEKRTDPGRAFRARAAHRRRKIPQVIEPCAPRGVPSDERHRLLVCGGRRDGRAVGNDAVPAAAGSVLRVPRQEGRESGDAMNTAAVHYTLENIDNLRHLLCLVREFFTETGMLPAEIAYHGRRLRYDPVAANAVIKGALDEDAYIGRNGLE